MNKLVTHTLAILVFCGLLTSAGSQEAQAAHSPQDLPLTIQESFRGMPSGYCYNERIEDFAWQARCCAFGYNEGTAIADWCGTADITVTFAQINGNMQWRVKPPKRLAVCGTIDLHYQSVIDAADIRGGDANNDNRVDINDLHIFRPAFNSNCTLSYYDRRSDWNNDCTINVQDFNELKTSFGSAGCPAL